MAWPVLAISALVTPSPSPPQQTIEQSFANLNALGVFTLLGACAGFAGLFWNLLSFWLKDVRHIRINATWSPANQEEALKVLVRNSGRRELTVSVISAQWKLGFRRWTQPTPISPISSRPNSYTLLAGDKAESTCPLSALSLLPLQGVAEDRLIGAPIRVFVDYGAKWLKRSRTIRPGH